MSRTTWTCETCEERPMFKSWAAAERHARTHPGARISVAVTARRGA